MNGPGSNNRFSLPGYVVRKAVEADLEAINEIGEEEHFDIGMENLRLYFKTSPDGWHVLEETATGRIVAYDSYNLMPNGIYMGHQIVVRSSERGKGLTRMFNSMSYATFPSMGNATSASVKRYYFDIFGPKLCGFLGLLRRSKVVRTTLERVTVKKLSTQDLGRFFAYDKSICAGIDRSAFIKEWALPTNQKSAETLVAWEGERIVGYGIVRAYTGFRWLSPVYADTPDIGDHLLRELFLALEDATFVFIEAPTRNRVVANLANELELKTSESEIRVYGPKTQELIGQHLDWDKIYGLQEYWPC